MGRLDNTALLGSLPPAVMAMMDEGMAEFVASYDTSDDMVCKRCASHATWGWVDDRIRRACMQKGSVRKACRSRKENLQET